MFLLLILFGLLALGLAFVTYWQADVQGTSRQKLDPPVVAARKSAASKIDDPGAARSEPAPGAPTSSRDEMEKFDHGANGR